MKKILPALFVMLALAPAAHAARAELASIDCLATNGVIIKGANQRGDSLKVDTQWGLFHEEFTAAISGASTSDTTYVSLDSKTDHYVLALDAAPVRTSEIQKASGTILRPSTVRGLQPSLVAYVRCDLQLR